MIRYCTAGSNYRTEAEDLLIGQGIRYGFGAMGRLTCAISTAQYTEAMCHLDGPDAAQAAAASFRMQASSPCQQIKIQQHAIRAPD